MTDDAECICHQVVGSKEHPDCPVDGHGLPEGYDRGRIGPAPEEFDPDLDFDPDDAPALDPNELRPGDE